MAAAIGRENTKVVSVSEIRSEFSDWMQGAAFCVMEEVRLSGSNRIAMMDKLKTAISNFDVKIVPKGHKGFMAPNVTNYLMLTNHKDALPLDDYDRRYDVLYSNYQTKDSLEGKDYYDQLYAVLDDPDNVRRYLGSRDVSGFPRFQKPDLSGTIRMVEETKTDEQLIVEDVVTELGAKFYNDALRVTLEEHGIEYNNKSTPAILRRIGYERLKEKKNSTWFRGWVKT